MENTPKDTNVDTTSPETKVNDSEDDVAFTEHELKKESGRQTDLHVAAVNNEVSKVKDLLEKPHLCINSRNKNNETSLFIAAENGHYQVAEYLLERGADPNIRNFKGHTAIFAAARKNYTEVVRILIESSHGTDISLCDYDGRTVLHESLYEAAKCILESKRRIDIDAVDFDGNTSLHLAISRGGYNFASESKSPSCCALFRILLEYGADINIRNLKGRTPLIEASLRNQGECVSLLLKDAKHQVQLDIRDNKGNTALICAVQKANFEIARMLLDAGADINCSDANGFTALHIGVFYPETKILLDNIEDIFNRTGKKISAKQLEKKRLVTELLVKREGLNIDKKDFCNRTAIELERQSLNFYNKLNKIFGRPICDGNSYQTCFSHNHIDDDNELASIGLIDVLHSLDEVGGKTLLHRMTLSGYHFFFSRGEMPFSQMTTDFEIFHVFSFLCRKLGTRADWQEYVNFRDCQGRTALHYAYMHSELKFRWQITRTLLRCGAKKDILDIYGRMPQDYSFKDEFLITGLESKTYKNKPAGCRTKGDNKTYKERKIEPICGTNIIGRLIQSRFSHNLSQDIRKNFLKLIAPESYSIDIVRDTWRDGSFAYRNATSISLLEKVTGFVERLLKFVTEREPRFANTFILVGSARENTKINVLDEFDFDVILERLGSLCQIDKSSTYLNSYAQIKKNICNQNQESDIDDFNMFFDKHGILLTNEINWRFQLCIQSVLRDKQLWANENYFALDINEEIANRSWTTKICATVKLLVNEFPFEQVSLDIVPCIHIDNWWPSEAISSTDLKAMTIGCNLVFDQPERKRLNVPYSSPYSRISFAPAESHIVSDSPAVARAALMVAKHIVKKPKHSYVLKTCLLYCLEALRGTNDGEMNMEEVKENELKFWVQKLLKCYLLFCLQDFVPCYFLPDFHMPFTRFAKSNHALLEILGVNSRNGFDILKDVIASNRSTVGGPSYCTKICNVIDEVMDVYRLYWSVCDDDTEVNFFLPCSETEDRWQNRDDLIAAIRFDL